MATITQIHNLRIRITDPYGIIKINSIATTNLLPSDPKPQTLYYCTADELYYKTDLKYGVTEDDYYNPELYLSDNTISDLIDAHGTSKAAYKAVRRIASKLAGELMIVKQVSGTSSTEYIKLLDLYNYYKNIVQDMIDEEKEENNNTTGRYYSTSAPEIAGGNT